MGDIESQKDIEIQASNKKIKNTSYALRCTVLASMTSIILGYDIGVMSGAADYIKSDLKISDTQLEVLLGMLQVYSLLGSGFGGWTADRIGRRWTMFLAGCIFAVGAVVMGVAPNYGVLMTGRFISGVGVGYGMMVAPVYTTELSPASTRGFLTSFPEIFINVGILLGYVANLAFSPLKSNINWRLMLGFALVPSVLLATIVLVMPESPRWLVMKGRLSDAKVVLSKTSDSEEEAQQRLDDIKESAGIPKECNDDVVKVSKKKSQELRVWKELIIHPTPAVRHILIASIGIHFFQQASGIDSVVLYSTRIFEKAGITSETKKLIMTVAIGVVKTLTIFIGALSFDRFGRRPVILTSMGGMAASLLILGSMLTIIGSVHKTLMPVLVICIMMVFFFVSFFSMGMGPVAWVYCSEIFPLRLRAQGFALGVGVNRLTSGIIAMTFLSMYKAITIGGAFLLYGGIAVVAWIFFYFVLPETKGTSLEKVERLFGWGRNPESEPEKIELERIEPEKTNASV